MDVMHRSRRADGYQTPDWEALYRLGTPPWESGVPSGELVRVLDEGLLRPGRTLEIGCGTGADAVYLARRGFEVTAVETSPTALERARGRAQRAGALIQLVLGDVFDFARTSGPFDLVYDAGFYHFIRRVELGRFLDLLWRVTQPGSYYLTLAGNTGETAEGGPPQVSEEEIRGELCRLFRLVHLRPFRFESPAHPEGYLGWSCLMQRPKVAT
jgi:SAM-dependent methyltransferase